MVAAPKERKIHPAAQCVRVDLQHPGGFVVARRKVSGGPSRPIVKKDKWNDIPGWISLYAERGHAKKCWNGCKLLPATQDGRKYDGCQIRGCDWRPPAGSPIMACSKCKWSVCERCTDRPRMPTLAQDPLFHGPDDPCMLMYPQFEGQTGRGTVIVCPGGNYEFLSPLEGLPVVEWLAQQGIGAVVLRYRLLPDYSLDDCLDDLEAAAARLRGLRPGPVAALGFSAGGHLIASLALRAHKQGKPQPLDAQVLVYPGIDGKDWYHPDYNGFFNKGKWKIPNRAESLHAWQNELLGGEGFMAPPSCLVGSTDDTCTPNEQHTDVYHAALMREKIPNVYLRDAFGEHGFELKGGWTPGCVKWLHSRGFGGKASLPGVHGMSLRNPAPRVPLDENQRPTSDLAAGEAGSSMDCTADENSPSCFAPPHPLGARDLTSREEEMAAAKAIAKNMNLALVDFASMTPAPQGMHTSMDLGLGLSSSAMPPPSMASSVATDATLPTHFGHDEDRRRMAPPPTFGHATSSAPPPPPSFGLPGASPRKGNPLGVPPLVKEKTLGSRGKNVASLQNVTTLQPLPKQGQGHASTHAPAPPLPPSAATHGAAGAATHAVSHGPGALFDLNMLGGGALLTSATVSLEDADGRPGSSQDPSPIEV